ncbi:MAG: ABC transporter ATP-binding protein [Elusimicrobiota bacterium]
MSSDSSPAAPVSPIQVHGEIAIRARDLGKQYQIQTFQDRTFFRQALSFLGKGPARRPLWALRGINFEVKRGECVGVIGPNGSGKSTLLQILGGILSPTEGSVETRGLITPFIGVGSAAYSDLSVMDNLRLICALMGSTPDETRQKIPDIIRFAEIDDYLYARLCELSSGYQGRVVFSTALHAPIDILLVDEAFATGDTAFQNKCMVETDRLRREGTTIVIVSHSMEFVRSYCGRAVYLEKGQVQADGAPVDVTREYLSRHGLADE